MAERSGTCKRGKLKREEKTEGKKKEKDAGKGEQNSEKQSNGPTGFSDWHQNVFSSMIDIAGSRFLRGRGALLCL